MNDNNNTNSSNFKIENIKRCLECNKIPLIEISENKNGYFINYCCENNHKGEISLNDFFYKQKNILNKIPCSDCQKIKEMIFLDFFIV